MDPDNPRFKMMQAFDDAIVLRQFRLVLAALMCRECCPGAPCDDHACDVDLIATYQIAHSQLAQQTD